MKLMHTATVAAPRSTYLAHRRALATFKQLREPQLTSLVADKFP